MSAQHTPGPLSWVEIIGKQQALIERCRNFDERGYEVRCLLAIERAADNDARARAIAKANSLARLGKSDGVAFASDVDKRVPVIASGAQEEAPISVDLGRHSPEHDFETAVPALPHGGAPVGNGDRTSAHGIAQATGSES